METKIDKPLWIVTDPEGVVYLKSAATTKSACWDKFCYPALNKRTYIRSDWKAIKYKLTLNESIVWKP